MGNDSSKEFDSLPGHKQLLQLQQEKQQRASMRQTRGSLKTHGPHSLNAAGEPMISTEYLAIDRIAPTDSLGSASSGMDGSGIGSQQQDQNLRNALIEQQLRDSIKNDANLNRQDFVLEGRRDDVIVKLPRRATAAAASAQKLYSSSALRQQYTVENCHNCEFYLCEISGQITIDDCKNCKFFIGPCAGSIFIRTSSNCKVVICGCQQLRLRECSQMDVMLCCASRPIIEDSKSIRFGCFDYFYMGLKQQFERAGLSVFNNEWSNVYDFSSSTSSSPPSTLISANYSLLDERTTVTQLVHPLSDVAPQFMTSEEEQYYMSDSNSLIVPKTHGLRDHVMVYSTNTVVLFFSGHAEDAMLFCQKIAHGHKDIILHRTKECTFNHKESMSLWSQSNNKTCAPANADFMRKRVQQGPVVAISVCAGTALTTTLEGIAQMLKSIIKEIIPQASSSSYFVSATKAEVDHMRDYLFDEHRMM